MLVTRREAESLLGRLLTEDPRPIPDALEDLRLNTSAPDVAGAVVILARKRQASRERDLEALLYSA